MRVSRKKPRVFSHKHVAFFKICPSLYISQLALNTTADVMPTINGTRIFRRHYLKVVSCRALVKSCDIFYQYFSFVHTKLFYQRNICDNFYQAIKVICLIKMQSIIFVRLKSFFFNFLPSLRIFIYFYEIILIELFKW